MPVDLAKRLARIAPAKLGEGLQNGGSGITLLRLLIERLVGMTHRLTIAAKPERPHRERKMRQRLGSSRASLRTSRSAMTKPSRRSPLARKAKSAPPEQFGVARIGSQRLAQELRLGIDIRASCRRLWRRGNCPPASGPCRSGRMARGHGRHRPKTASRAAARNIAARPAGLVRPFVSGPRPR